ncbi:MAG: chemotaxis protein CheW [Gammaproteobacteria bacterium]
MESNAWLLKDINGDYFAVSEVEMVEYIPTVQIFSVPVTPTYCNSIVPWREQLIPVMNIALLFDTPDYNEFNKIGIFAYQINHNTPLQYLAIPIQGSPIHIVVKDSQLCELPDRFSGDKKSIALSCFNYQEQSVVIINLNYLVTTNFGDGSQGIKMCEQKLRANQIEV